MCFLFHSSRTVIYSFTFYSLLRLRRRCSKANNSIRCAQCFSNTYSSNCANEHARTVRTFRDHQVFSKRQIIFRPQVKGWRSWRRPGNRCPRHEPIPPQLIPFTHVRVKVILIYVRRSRNCDESPLHTALCAGEEADGYLAPATRIPIEHSFIRQHSP